MSESPAPCVFIVDDDDEMRESLVYLLRTVGLSTRSYRSAREFFAEYRQDWPGCLVCDVRMPDVSGLDLYERLVQAGGTLPVIFMTAYADVPMAIRALRSGAVEFIEKPFNAQVMLERIQRAIVTDREGRQLALKWDEFGQRMASLTDKEHEALQLIMEGAPNKAIAVRLGISERAVEMRRASVTKKLQVHSLAELIRLVTQYEIFSESRNRPRA